MTEADNAPQVARQRTAHSVLPAVTVGATLALTGLLLTTSEYNADDERRAPHQLTELLEDEKRRHHDAAETLDQLTTDITKLEDQRDSAVPSATPTTLGVLSGTVPVTGPGVRISLNDAPADVSFPGVTNPQMLVVHQSDVQSVVNALWAGGAEAMTLQGQRVTPTSAFRCVGNTLQLHGQVFSPPFVIQAIGDVDRLSAQVNATPTIQIYQSYAREFGLGWSLEILPVIEAPRHTSEMTLQYAEPIGKEF